jgi:hypothetical protein
MSTEMKTTSVENDRYNGLFSAQAKIKRKDKKSCMAIVKAKYKQSNRCSGVITIIHRW